MSHINDCIEGDTDIVINCTGVHARTFGGVEDADVYPAKGQIVTVQSQTRLNWAFLKHPALSNTRSPFSGLSEESINLLVFSFTIS